VIPDGWVLVPVVPSERMLTEFSGVWAPWLPKKRRELELKAYADMLAVVPTAPVGDSSQVQALQAQIRRLYKELDISKAETKKAYKKLKYAWDKIRALEVHNERTDSIH
jgi:hypothetical protein